MRINSVLLNILLLILLAILIYLYLYTNYSTYENFESSQIVDINNLNIGTLNPTTSQIMPLIEISNPKIDDQTKDGSLPSFAFRSANSIINYNEVMINNNLKNGYYWVNLPVAGPRFIYIISDESIFGGGWLLAMRSVVNSKTFNYDSKHWTRNSTLNADLNSIKSLFPDSTNPNNDLIAEGTLNKTYKKSFEISSIGSIIQTTTDSRYDCKLDTFNYYNAKELMIIFYYNNINGGDFKDNKNGWIWKETLTETGNGITLLQLFQFLEQRDFNTKTNIKANYAVNFFEDTKKNTISKIKKDDTYPIWYASKSPNFNFYGINYEQSNGASNYSAVRLGYLFTNESKTKITINGIGLGYSPPNQNENVFSAGRYSNDDVDTTKGPSKNPNTEKSATSMSFELYVR